MSNNKFKKILPQTAQGMRKTDFFQSHRHLVVKGSIKNKLVEFAPKFAVDFIDLIEQNRRNSGLFRGRFY